MITWNLNGQVPAPTFRATQGDRIRVIFSNKIVLEGKAKDIDYIIKLGLMKGHLLVDQELLAKNKPDQAEPHIGI